MAQHFVLMSVAPPLIVLGCPFVPMLQGLPQWFFRGFVAPFLRSALLHKLKAPLTSLSVAGLAMNLAYVGWHIPRAYEFALSSERWHNFEHLCFLLTSILFWWPIVAPWPSRRTASPWALIAYLLLSDFVNTGLSALLCFSGRLFYPSYGLIDRPFGIDAVRDQTAAGAFMWVFGSTVFLVPAAIITWQALERRQSARTEPTKPLNTESTSAVVH
jgi:cytochrome c oxidase assembly factor CtaG